MSIIIKSGASGDLASVKPASTAPIATDTSLVVTISPNSPAQTISGTVTANQGGTWNINNISGTVSLPTGASTSALQTTGNTSLATIVTNTTGMTVTQGSTSSGQTGQLIQGTVTTAAPSYTTAQTNPLSLTTVGNLRVDGSSVTQPISGTVSANAGTGNFTVVQTTGTNLHTVVDSGTITAVTAITNALPVGSNLIGKVGIDQTTPGTTNRVAGNIDQISGAAPSTTNALPARLTDGTGFFGSVVNNGQRYLTNALIQNVIASVSNNSTANLAASATFTGTSETILGVAAIQINFKADQAVTIQAQQSTDGTNWDIVDTYTLAANTGDGRTFQATSSFFRALVTNNGASTTTFLRLQSTLCPIVEVLPRALTNSGNLKVSLSETPITLPVAGNVANAAADSGNPVKIGGVFNTTIPALTAGQRGDVQVDARGALLVTKLDGGRATYNGASLNIVPALTATDIFTITGSASKTIRVIKVGIAGVATAAGVISVVLLKRSTANTVGTSAAVTAVPLDSNSAAASGTVLSYTANPTTGNLVGNIVTPKVLFPAAASVANGYVEFEFGNQAGQAIVLRGTAQVLAVNFAGVTLAGGSVSCYVQWTEE